MEEATVIPLEVISCSFPAITSSYREHHLADPDRRRLFATRLAPAPASLSASASLASSLTPSLPSPAAASAAAQRVVVDIAFKIADAPSFEAHKAVFRVPLTGFSSPFDAALFLVADEWSDVTLTASLNAHPDLAALPGSDETYGTWRVVSYVALAEGQLEAEQVLPRRVTATHVLVKLLSHTRRNAVLIAEFASLLGKYELPVPPQPVQENAPEEKPKSLAECLKAGRCTFAFSGRKTILQEWQECLTCNLRNGLGACTTCIGACHAGHTLGRRFTSGPEFYCDCGADRPECKCVHVAVPSAATDPDVRAPVNPRTAVAECVAARRCTRTGTGPVFVVQTWYFCLTCGMTEKSGEGICESCRVICHEGHNVQLPPPNRLNTGFYCDCFDRADCKCSK